MRAKKSELRFPISLNTVKPVLSGHSKRRPKIGFQDRLSLNEGRKYCRNALLEHSATLWTFIKLPFVFNYSVDFIFLSFGIMGFIVEF